MPPRQTTFERATFEYDHEFEAALTEAIATTIFETSRVTDVNAVVVRTGETARALTRTLTMVLALSPSVTRQTIDEISECLRRYVAKAERDDLAQEFLRGPSGARTLREMHDARFG